MRTIYVSFLVAFATMLCLPAKAQVKIGIRGGIDATALRLNNDVLDKDNRVGFHIGPTMKLSILGIGFDASVLYDQRQAKVSYDEVVNDGQATSSATLTQKQIAIPVNARYTFGLGSTANIFLFAGPQVGFNVGSDNDNIDWKWKDSNFSVNVGFGVTMLSHLQLSANYNIACGKTGEASLYTVADGLKDYHARYNAWQIGLAYYF